MPTLDIVSDVEESPLPPHIIKTRTVKEVYEAIEKNGLEHLRENWLTSDYSGGCVLAQGAFNLGVLVSEGWGEDEVAYRLFEDAEYANTHTSYGVRNRIREHSLESQLNRFKIPTNSKWSVPNSMAGAASAIIYWNDLRARDADGRYILEDGEFTYHLPTYEDVAKMAYDVLSPFFDETVELVEFDYDKGD